MPKILAPFPGLCSLPQALLPLNAIRWLEVSDLPFPQARCALHFCSFSPALTYYYSVFAKKVFHFSFGWSRTKLNAATVILKNIYSKVTNQHCLLIPK